MLPLLHPYRHKWNERRFRYDSERAWHSRFFNQQIGCCQFSFIFRLLATLLFRRNPHLNDSAGFVSAILYICDQVTGLHEFQYTFNFLYQRLLRVWVEPTRQNKSPCSTRMDGFIFSAWDFAGYRRWLDWIGHWGTHGRISSNRINILDYRHLLLRLKVWFASYSVVILILL